MIPEVRPRRLTFLLRIVVSSSVFGAVYGSIVALASGLPLTPVAISDGAGIGAGIALLCMSYDSLLLPSRLGEALRRGPFLLLVAVKTIWYGASIVLALYIGSALLEARPWSMGEPRIYVSAAISFLIAFSVSLTTSIRRLLGPGVLGNVLAGRYSVPREEERVFLFVDMVGSTRIAEQIGNTGFMALLDRFVADLTEPILATDGEIYRYVGDEVIVTWPLARGAREGACVACLMAMRERIAAAAPAYERRFGVAPRFRAALHAGPVVAGEMGDAKREIVFLGDTINTTARIEQACRDLDAWALISGPLLDRLKLPVGIKAKALGPIALRGKSEPIALHALA
jgi:adenylate cyclase